MLVFSLTLTAWLQIKLFMKYCIHSNIAVSLINTHITFYRKIVKNVIQNSFHTSTFWYIAHILSRMGTFIRIHTVTLASCNVSHINVSGVTKMPRRCNVRL